MKQNLQNQHCDIAGVSSERTGDASRQGSANFPCLSAFNPPAGFPVSLLTGGSDKPYVFGLAMELLSKGVALDLIGSDELECPEFLDKTGISFINLRGDQRPDASFLRKMYRVSNYYLKLFRYAVTAEPKIFHILWNNKFETFDRTLLMLYYRFLRKKIVLTVHNVNADKRDSKDSLLNRLTLRIQYTLADHIFVHTEKMKLELLCAFDVQPSRVSVIPFGINNAVPNTRLTPGEAKQRLGIADGKKVILFFGRITPYKGLEYLVSAFRQIVSEHDDYRLIIAGRPDNCEKYWKVIQSDLQEDLRKGRILLRSEFIPDEETEVYFKGADVLVLPYKQIYQSGVLFLSHSFGLPVLAADVGSLKEDIVEGETGFSFVSEESVDLAGTLKRYFASDLFVNLSTKRQEIKNFAMERHSWDTVGRMTMDIYEDLLRLSSKTELSNQDKVTAPVNMKNPS